MLVYSLSIRRRRRSSSRSRRSIRLCMRVCVRVYACVNSGVSARLNVCVSTDAGEEKVYAMLVLVSTRSIGSGRGRVGEGRDLEI